jgi:predicted RNA binding protein YcfA (HicA-like mRNA interferase family)
VKLPRDISGAETVKALAQVRHGSRDEPGLEWLGFSVVRQAGSHARMAQENRRVTVPMHRTPVAGTLQSILRQAGVTLDEFVEAL